MFDPKTIIYAILAINNLSFPLFPPTGHESPLLQTFRPVPGVAVVDGPALMATLRQAQREPAAGGRLFALPQQPFALFHTIALLRIRIRFEPRPPTTARAGRDGRIRPGRTRRRLSGIFERRIWKGLELGRIFNVSFSYFVLKFL